MIADRLGNGLRLGVLVLAVAALGACGTATVVRNPGTSGAPVPTTSVAKPGATVTVKRGDTLYAIARQHNITPRDLAAWNRLSEPYTIYPGQSLRLYPAGATTATTTRPPATTPAKTPTPTPAPAPVATPPVKSDISWRWPAEGALVGRYVAGEATKQGVDIAGSSGQAVRAAANGVVVYSGAGLVGYGELIIVKHNEQWLSAYGHNRKRLVNEGQNVKAGEQIAEMGRTGANRDMLHFEIRYNGKPVDPLLYLPKK
ncbi:peptidoglycan DD-metalloendopeptidase family protein [Flavobacterium sp. MXW15]|uniref:Peptidoglycan DD-metalloendopeptidase family protein n=1 Tax=Xanthomonas chitinilytica TaxID=2989819 RepID=A0ABT3JZW5_9XANT|nr:peptidoglycan DD-metalloendopeptidase family protein [Xanthomonas sp. H13-6]MCW4456327.1 peptidoglycan DD-metalloendopeptidase family protein [Flavobacterium sp. MXW15]MCW4474033.1 peptidoglycan DD-metalloendopeptidase family protein [Xanthomonas sp. H13-6]